MIDETREKIIRAAFNLISEKGYTATTTKDIAKLAGVNEVTIFRRFENKKGIFLYAMKEIKWFPELKEDIFEKCSWTLETDLLMFANIYFTYFTMENAKIIMGLRAPEIFPEIKEYALKPPNSFKEVLIKYFEIMYEKKQIAENEFDIYAGMFLSINFGFIFSKASFGEEFLSINAHKYIEKSIKVFAKGIALN